MLNRDLLDELLNMADEQKRTLSISCHIVRFAQNSCYFDSRIIYDNSILLHILSII